MALNPGDKLYTVVIKGLKDQASEIQVAEALVRVTKGASFEQIRVRLRTLPWTLTRKATAKRAAQLIKLLERRGARTMVIPPLPATPLPNVAETQIVPGAELLSETQIMSTTQFISLPPEPDETEPVALRSAAEPAAGPPKPPDSSGGGDSGIEPLTLGGILDRTFQVCRLHFWKLLTIIIMPYLAFLIAAGIVALAAGLMIAGFNIESLQGLSLWAVVMLTLTVVAAIIVLVIISCLTKAALIHATSCVYLDREILVWEAYRFAATRFVKYFLTTLLLLAVIVALIVIPIIFGVFLFYLSEFVFSSGWWSIVTWPFLALVPSYGIIKLLLVDEVVIIENTGYAAAFARSWSLLAGKAQSQWPRGYLLRLVILLHLFLLIDIVISWFFGIPGSLFAYIFSDWGIVGKIVEQVLSFIGGLVGGLFGSVCMVIFYYDIRNRKEGFDLEMLTNMTES